MQLILKHIQYNFLAKSNLQQRSCIRRVTPWGLSKYNIFLSESKDPLPVTIWTPICAPIIFQLNRCMLGIIVIIHIMETIKILVDWLWVLKCLLCVSKNPNCYFYQTPKPLSLKVNINSITSVHDCDYSKKNYFVIYSTRTPSRHPR